MAERDAKRNGWPFDVTLVLAVIPFVVATGNLWAIAAGDIAEFLAMIRNVDIPAMVIGTAMVILPFTVLSSLALLMLTSGFWESLRRLRDERPNVTALGATFVGMLLATSNTWAVGAIGLVAFYLIVMVVVKWLSKKPRRFLMQVELDPRKFLVAMAPTIALVWLLNGTISPGIGGEIVRTNSGVFPAYVLSSDEVWTVVYDRSETDRSVRYIPTEQVVGRRPCSTGSHQRTPLLALSGEGTPSCESLMAVVTPRADS